MLNKNPNELTDREILEILKGTTCASCEGRKRPMRSHCPKCYHSLSKAEQNALYREFNNGYQEAFIASLESLAAYA